MEALILVAELDGPTMFARIGIMRALNCHVERVFDPTRKGAALGPAQASEGTMIAFIYVNTSKQVGDAGHLKVFANVDAEKWFEENDPEGVAFEYEVLE